MVGRADVEMKVPSAENADLSKVLSLKPEIGPIQLCILPTVFSLTFARTLSMHKVASIKIVKPNFTRDLMNSVLNYVLFKQS